VPHRRARREDDRRLALTQEFHDRRCERNCLGAVIQRKPGQADLRQPVRLWRTEPIGE
jgi:hypothetical protein